MRTLNAQEKRMVNNLLAAGYIKSPEEFFCHEPWAQKANSQKAQKKKTASKKPTKKKGKMTNHFATAKNFQGFDKHLCVFEPTINDFVFVPKNYGVVTKAQQKVNFCPKCMLTPCINIENKEAMVLKAYDLKKSNDKSSTMLGDRMETYMKRLMVKYFGREYSTKKGIPDCVLEEIVELTKPEEPAEQLEDSQSWSDDDEEFEFS